MEQATKTPWWFWVLGLIFLIWNFMGVLNFLGTVMATPESYAAKGYTVDQVAFVTDVPIFYITIFALAVLSGFLGALVFLLRKAWATKVFLFSLVFILISLIVDFVGGAFTVLGTGYLGIMLFVTVMGIVQYTVSRMMVTKGHLH